MLKPLYDKVILEIEKVENKTKSGLVLPESDEKSNIGKVIAVGDGKIVEGKVQSVKVKEGDRVLYSKYSGTEAKIDGKEYVVVAESDILAIIE